MSEKVPDALRTEADTVEEMHTRGLADADCYMTRYQFARALRTIASSIDGENIPISDRWHFHKFIPNESEESNELHDKD